MKNVIKLGLILGVVSSLALAGCGDDDDDSNGTGGSGGSTGGSKANGGTGGTAKAGSSSGGSSTGGSSTGGTSTAGTSSGGTSTAGTTAGGSDAGGGDAGGSDAGGSDGGGGEGGGGSDLAAACADYCGGDDNVFDFCEGDDLNPDLEEATCVAECNGGTWTDFEGCYYVHLGLLRAEPAPDAAYIELHCSHATGNEGQAVCDPLPAP